MTFKTVHGLGSEHYAKKAVEVAMSKGMGPEYVRQWMQWFNSQPRDAATAPAPQYFIGDLEEVAHAVLSEVEAAMLHTAKTRYGAPIPPEVKEVLVGVAQRMATPGYVEGLLPCE